MVLVLSRGSLAGVPELEVSYVRSSNGSDLASTLADEPGSSGAALVVSGIQFPISPVPKNGKQ